jgi:predicted AAA+ superfamily ATPase
MTKNQKRKMLEQAGAKLPPRLVERKIKKEIVPWLNREEIIVLTGARQTGKSVVLAQLIYENILPKTTNIHYFNLDIKNNLKFFDSPDKLISLVSQARGKTYIIIDEVQRLKEPGLFLKGLYDLHLPLKLIVSGSSALEIKSKIHEALTGRKAVFHLNPFDFEELAAALFPQKSFSRVVQANKLFEAVLEHYLIYGGYPKVALGKGEKIKVRLLKEIFTSYLEKDIKAFFKVENETAFRNLIQLLSTQIGNLLNKDELSNSLGIHKNTLDNYLFYLEQTFILDLVRPFYKNPRKELLKNPKIYFRDAGLRNFAIRAFSGFAFRPDKGSLFENIVYLCLKDKIEEDQPIHFWRTKAGAELDFILLKGLAPVPFEVKAANMHKTKIDRAMRSFIQIYGPKRAYYVNLSLEGTNQIDKTRIAYLTMPSLLRERF